MPFITEKIYVELYNNDASIMISEWPKYDEEFEFEEEEKQIEKLKSIIVGIRNVRRDTVDKFKAMKKSGEITEDDLKHAEKKTQELTDKFIREIDVLEEKKQKEIMSI